jgi:dipeptidyl aminopeptidase/acylaminoacyl peptidase
MKTFTVLALLLPLGISTAHTQTKHPFTFEDMMKLKRVGAPVPSPDGKWVAFDCEDVDLEANTKTSHLWIVPASRTDSSRGEPAQGGESRRLNESPNPEERPRFSPDGKRMIWTSKATDPTQIWMCDFDPERGALAGQPHQVTNISTGADGGIWTGDGKNIVFVSAVYPDCTDDACNKQRDDELKKNKVKAKIFTGLLYRHWNAFTEFKRNHLFVVSAESGADFLSAGQANAAPAGTAAPAETEPPGKMPGGPTAGTAAPRDLTPGDHDVPPFNLGGQDMYAVSPDGQELAYTSNIDEVEATSTNNEIFIVPIAVRQVSNLPSTTSQVENLRHEPRKISTSPGSDNTPLYSRDGKYILWQSQARNGFESDKQSLIVYDRASGKLRNLTEKFDRSVGSFAITTAPYASKDPYTSVCFTAEDHGQSPLFGFAIEEDKSPQKLADGHYDDLVLFPNGTLYVTRMSIDAPNEIWSYSLPDARPAPVTHMNDALLSQIDMQPMESFMFKGADNADVQGLIIKPPGFDPNKKYPLKFLIHGGPQGAWGNDWSYRWNPELFAADGYVVVMINPRGSTGYGQAFTDAVSRDWGGKPFVDLMRGLDYVEKTYPFIDKTREAALGASYGGYMANWILGHTGRFKCIVSHDGMFNAESAYGTTEELWFNEWEFGGPPWKNRELYRKFSPHVFADKFKTPTLVVHGQLDYRLDVSEGFQLFTTLQRLKVPSKMLYFPDEGHWVLKPQNSRLWYKTVDDWVDKWCSGKASKG